MQSNFYATLEVGEDRLDDIESGSIKYLYNKINKTLIYISKSFLYYWSFFLSGDKKQTK